MQYKKVGLIGNPNVGKSALFNRLTDGDAYVGNWPGVTVESQVGGFQLNDLEVSVIDLPGCYACCSYTEEGALDEEEVMRFLLNDTVDLFVNVIDGRYLQRHLYLTCQLLEMGLPIVVVINMSDLLSKQQVVIDVDSLSEQLGCPVVKVSAKQNTGVVALKKLLVSNDVFAAPVPPIPDVLSLGHKQLVDKMTELLPNAGAVRLHWFARRWLEGDDIVGLMFSFEHREFLSRMVDCIREGLSESADLLLADQRYCRINELLQVCRGAKIRDDFTEKLDKWLLHKWLGVPVFFLVMYLVFLLSLGLGGFVQDLLGKVLDITLVQLPVQSMYLLFDKTIWPAMLVHGVGVGLSTIFTLMPVVIVVGLCLVLLEESGYMTRAAFLIDRLMLFLKLPGRSFIAMILGFGCNVPAVAATRTLASPKDRAMTIMMVPFMSCTARLTVYTALTSLFYPQHGALVVLFLYVLGFVIGLVTAWVLRIAWGGVDSVPLVMDFPAYQLPLLSGICQQVIKRSMQFMKRALRVVIVVSLLLSIFSLGDLQFILLAIGKSLVWLLQPMGMQVDQWPAAIALLFGALAKEVVVGGLNTLYAQQGAADLLLAHINSWSDIWFDLQNSLMKLFDWQVMHQGVMLNKMAQVSLLDKMHNSLAYLSFILLYLPCVSTLVVIAKELSWRWAVWGLVWSTVLAYGVSVLIYQFGCITQGVDFSISVIVKVVICMAVFALLLIKWVRKIGVVV